MTYNYLFESFLKDVQPQQQSDHFGSSWTDYLRAVLHLTRRTRYETSLGVIFCGFWFASETVMFDN